MVERARTHRRASVRDHHALAPSCRRLDRRSDRSASPARIAGRAQSRPLPRTAVVLGGAINPAGPGDLTREVGYDLSSAADRVVAAAHLYRNGKLDLVAILFR